NQGCPLTALTRSTVGASPTGAGRRTTDGQSRLSRPVGGGILAVQVGKGHTFARLADPSGPDPALSASAGGRKPRRLPGGHAAEDVDDLPSALTAGVARVASVAPV